MKTTLVLAATAALASAQVTYDPATGKYKCPKPNTAYCAGDSLGTDIIIRCDANGVGQPGRCTDNLAGQPPLGVQPALCYQSDALKGDAACEKNCVVYAQPSFTLPSSVCTPYYTASSSTYPPTTITTYPPTSPPTYTPTTLTSYPPSSPPTYTPTYTPTTPTSSCPPTTLSTYKPTSPPPTGYPTYTPPPHGNGTATYTQTENPTKTPVNPTKPTYTPPTVTAGASANQVGAGALAAVGLAAVLFL